MSRILSLALLGLAALASTVSLAPSASATAATLTCQIRGDGGPPRQSVCGTFQAASTYFVHNLVSNGPASGYTWTKPAGISGFSGCTSTSNFCDITFRSDQTDHDLITKVQINGTTLTVKAVIPATCGAFLC